MPVTKAVIPDAELQQQGTGQPAPVSLNSLFNDSLRKAQLCYALPDLIVRCAALPHTMGDSESIQRLFDQLLGMILQSPPNGSKLFLFIDCEIQAGTNDATTSGFRNYLIKFITNLTTDDNWKKSHAKALSRSQEIISLHNWIFLVNNINHTGCLFSITVPGKYE